MKTVADLLVAVGGISRSFYIIGMVCAHFVAKLLYKKALIEDLFMLQKPKPKSQEPDSAYMKDSTNGNNGHNLRQSKSFHSVGEEFKPKVEDEFKHIYKDVKTALNDEKQGLLRRHINTMVNTILRRK